MATMLFNGLVSLLGSFRTPRSAFEKEMLTYAKTEYGKDWQYAYNFMLDHKGRAPSHRDLSGPVYVRKEVA